MPDASAEKRRYRRFALSCPIELLSEAGQLVADVQLVNLSDGGALVLVPGDAVPAVGSLLNVRLQAPSDSSGAGPLRKFICQAKVLRHQATCQPGKTAVAIEFLQPLPLELDKS